ncbi:hypothetical protein D3C87_2061160 [compost metagenome]
MQSARGISHYADIFRLADNAATHGHHGVGAENIGVFPRLLALKRRMRSLGLL